MKPFDPEHPGEQIGDIDDAVSEAEAERADLLLRRIVASTSKGVGMVGKILR